MDNGIFDDIFVFTRDLTKNYGWVCLPKYLNGNYLLQVINKEFDNLNIKGVFTSKWYRIGINNTGSSCVFRIVVDGRRDLAGELIKRYEGAVIFNKNIDFSLVEDALFSKRKSTNDYNFFGNGFNSVFDLKRVKE